MDFVACTNKRYFPKKDLVEIAKEIAQETGATITLTVGDSYSTLEFQNP